MIKYIFENDNGNVDEYEMAYSGEMGFTSDCSKCDFMIDGECHAPKECRIAEYGFKGCHWIKCVSVKIQDNHDNELHAYAFTDLDENNNTTDVNSISIRICQ